MNQSDVIAFAGVAVAAASLLIAAESMRQSSISASAAAWVSISSDFRSAWLSFGQGESDFVRDFHFSELMAIFEVTSAMYEKRIWKGVTRELAHDYLLDCFKFIEASDDARKRISLMIQNPNDLKYVKMFVKTERKKGNLLLSKETVKQEE